MSRLLQCALGVGAPLLRKLNGLVVPPRDMRRILICATGGVGNTVLLLPLVRSLKEALPEAKVDLLLTNSAAVELAREAGWVDEVLQVSEQTWYEGLSGPRFFLTTLRKRKYDAVLRTYLTAPAMARASLAAFLSGAPVRVAYGEAARNRLETHVLKLDESRTEVDRHLALAGALGVAPGVSSAQLEVPERGRRWAAEFLAARGWDGRRPLVGFHPGSDHGWAAKRWPAERFAEMATIVTREHSAQALVIGGPADREAIERVAADAEPGTWFAIGQDIVQTVGLIERCAAFVSNDSGLMHLASALEIPTVALFGPTDPVKNRPLGKHTAILRLGLECSPCDRETATYHCGHRNCLMTLGSDRVMAALGHALAKRSQEVSLQSPGAFE